MSPTERRGIGKERATWTNCRKSKPKKLFGTPVVFRRIGGLDSIEFWKYSLFLDQNEILSNSATRTQQNTTFLKPIRLCAGIGAHEFRMEYFCLEFCVFTWMDAVEFSILYRSFPPGPLNCEPMGISDILAIRYSKKMRVGHHFVRATSGERTLCESNRNKRTAKQLFLYARWLWHRCI